VLYIEQVAEGGLQGGGELGPAVCGSGGDRYGFRPARGSVNDGEQMSKTFGCRKGAYQVHVYVAETAGGYRDVLGRNLYMAVDLGPLAVQAGLRPGGNIRGETFPDVSR
jgi:hypothetical protein